MESDIPDSLHYLAVEQRIAHLTGLTAQIQAFLLQARLASIPESIYDCLFQIETNLKRIHETVHAIEVERKGVHSLFQISQFINSTLELNDVLRIAMDNIISLTHAERGFLMLSSDKGKLSIRVARNWEQESIDRDEWAISRTVIHRVVTTGEPVLTTDAQEDRRFNTQESISAKQLRSILCVPLTLKGALIGVIYADHRLRRGIFTVRERDLLIDFANQAAVAIENARLFASVRKTLAEVRELKGLTDRVFSSIDSGVLTLDREGKIVLVNRAAEDILRRPSAMVLNRRLAEVLPDLAQMLAAHIERVHQSEHPVAGIEASVSRENGERQILRVNLSPLKDGGQQALGIAIVIEDLTEIRRLEAQRRLFERMVSPQVVAHLDLNQLQLGGQRREVTLLFSDLRSFTQFSETIEPEQLVAVLNCYLAAAVEAVMSENGTVDKFLGDAVMAWFNAPVPQPDHSLRAVRAALSIRALVERLHENMPEAYRLSFGTGIHTGEAVLGLIGTEQRSDYTAIGDCVNAAKRIQESAAPGQILISEEVYQQVGDAFHVRSVEPVQAKGKREPIKVYEVLSIRE